MDRLPWSQQTERRKLCWLEYALKTIGLNVLGVAALVGAVHLAPPVRAGSILREVWFDVPGAAISDLTANPSYPNQPSATNEETVAFESPTNVAENYGQRMHGYIVPPVSGEYTFWIATDDGGELWLSTDENPANRRRIAYVSGWTSPREWTREPNQRSAAIRLEATRPYYISALQKEAAGGDNLAVRWMRPDGVDEAPIPATYLLPWGTVFAPPKILEQPTDTTVIEGHYASFEVKPDPLSPATVQWQRNGVDLSGATSPVLEFGPATLSDQNARLRARLSNRLGSVTSDEGILTVTADLTPPTVASVLNLSTTTLRVIFSEPLDVTSASTAANYKITGLQITGAALADESTVLLTTSGMTLGAGYTLTISNVRDRAAAGNAIASTVLNFTAVDYVPVNIGNVTGETRIVPGGHDITGAGAAIGGGASDQCHFAYQEKVGDFDVQVRVNKLGIASPFMQAGLMVRQSLDAASPFAGVFSSSAQLGCFVSTRAVAGAPAQTSAPAGGFPVNYPQMWLRLKRSGNQFTGYGSFDGQTWQTLATASVTMSPKTFFGMTVSSHSTNRSASAQFRDLRAATETGSFTYSWSRERLGPSTRRTGLVFSELMYHPVPRPDGKNLEFIEIYNGDTLFIDLSGWRLAGAVEYAFPDGFKLEAGDFAVVAADPSALEAVTGLRGVLGPYTGRLNNAGDALQLRNAAGAIRLELEYGTDAPWPVAADGLGHSLVLTHPSYGEDDPRSWSASERAGGSPGDVDAIVPDPRTAVMINEYLAHTDDPVLDFIELYNASNVPVDLSGCLLSDDASTNKFTIPAGTTIPPRGFISFNQNQLGFSLNAAGETIVLRASDQSRVLDAVRFGGQENGVSSGRVPDGAPTIRRLETQTPGAPNAAWRAEPVVINEIMYHPISGDDADQFVELYNRSSTTVNLGGWQFISGIDFQFPQGASLAPGGYIVVAKNAARLRTNYTQLTAANTFGDFAGSLAKGGERLALAKPDTVISSNLDGTLATNRIQIVVSEVTYFDGGRWSDRADGAGSSLELIDPAADTLRAANWAASDESQKASWTTLEYTGRLDLGNTGNSNNRLQIIAQGAGEYLIDEVEVFRPGSTNLLANGGFENGATGWTFFGNHRGSAVETSGAAAGQGVLHVRALGDGDTGNNSIRAPLASTIPTGQTATIRAKARWLSGWPEMLFRLRGNWLELAARLDVPKNLGSPGQRNSRAVNNAGPAIYDVTHTPALPRAGQPVVVTCRVSDPDGVAAPRVRWRADPSSTLTNVTMRDDGTAGDALAGDGLYSATISGRPSGTLVAFRIEATDDAPSAATTVFPPEAPARECLVRWEDPLPFGTFAQYHMWNTAAVDSARNSSRPLDNTYRDCTLVYGNSRVIYNAGFRDKGSPYHGGSGDYAVTVPSDDLLLGAADRVFGSTGNGGSEATGIRGDVSAWIGEQLGIPFLHSHFIRVYRNGGQFRDVVYDLEQPNPDYAEAWFGGGDPGDQLYKIAVWFEFADDNSNFQATGATLERFLSGGAYKLARYRWNWQIRPSGDTANDLSSIFNLATAANNSADRVTGLMNLADVDQWMRVFAFNRVLGNWDSWTFNVGQNMYIYAPLGGRAVLMPWDIDFVLGEGNGTGDALSGGQDPVMNQIYNVPTFRRMLWRAYQDAVSGPMLPENYGPQVDLRRAALLENGIRLADPRGIKTYLEGRRNYIQNQIKAADALSFAITSNGGTDYTSDSPVTTFTGTAPFAVATIEVNGIPYPAAWTSATSWRIDVPLGAATNRLQFIGRSRTGAALPGATASVTVRYTGQPPTPEDWVIINEIMYNAPLQDAEFLELYNRHPTVPFDLSGLELSGAGFTFAPGTIIAPNGYLVIVKDRAEFASLYGATVPVAGEFSGRLDNGGETLRLVRPDPAGGSEFVLDDVRYDSRPPWPVEADGSGASLQLIDPEQDNWRAGNWSVAQAGAANPATPGRVNTTRASIQPFPPLWINEVLPSNLAGITDNLGEREPWIELYNAGSTPLDLSAFYLSNDPTNVTAWAFPAGTSLGAGQYLVVWADGQPAQTTAGALHAPFRLNPTNGVVTLARLQLGASAVMDYLSYTLASADRSFGSVPDGEPRRRRQISVATPGGPNNPSSPAVQLFINEWLASNRTGLTDPADGKFDDWFELHNAGATAVDLSGFHLATSDTNRSQFRIPDGVFIGAGGFRLFWADNEPSQNAPGRDVHTSFRLPADGGQIALFNLDGGLVDSVTFGPQTTDVSEGRFPDGAAPPFFSFTSSSPGAANITLSGNRPPALSALSDLAVLEGQTVSFRAVATDPDVPAQALLFDLPVAPSGASINPSTGEFTWTPPRGQAPGPYPVTVRVTDNGAPVRSALRSLTITVVQINQPPVLAQLADVAIDEEALYTVRAEAFDPNLPPQRLTFSLAPGAPSGAAIDAVTGEFSWTPSEDQSPGMYSVTVRVTDDGQPPLQAERSFTLAVQEVNRPPEITQIPPQSIDEGALWQIQIEARDPETPPVTLSYTLESAPAGVTLDSGTGRLAWTPSEADGPRDYNITVRVTKAGGTLSAAMSFLVGVREVNVPPTLEAPARFTLGPGDFLSFTNRAADADAPRQTLTFSAVNPLPAGASLDSVTGVFSWQLSDDPAGGDYSIIIRVRDDGTPSQSTDATVLIVVQAPPRIVINEIMHRPAAVGAEYVELANLSANNQLDLTGWTLTGYNYVFPAGTLLPPASFLCVARDVTAFRAAYGNGPVVLGNAVNTLPADGGTISLLKPPAGGGSGEIVDTMTFDLRPPWPAAASQGASLQLIDPRQDHYRVGNWSASLASSRTNAPANVVAMTGSWKYWQNEASPGASWNSPSFNDTTWPSGRGLFYVESAALPATKSTALTLGRRTYYFRTPFTFSGNTEGARIRINTVLDDGAVFYLNGREIYRIGMPAGTVTQTTFASRTVGDAVLEGPFEVDAAGLRAGENVLAVEVHQINAGSTDVAFGAAFDLITISPAGFTPGARNSSAAEIAAFPPVWINEVLCNNTTGLTDNAGDRDPWIELYNGGAFPLSLGGWSLTDDYNVLGKWTFPATAMLPARGFLIVWADNEPSESAGPVYHTSFRLPAPAGAVALAREQGTERVVVDYVNYSTSNADQAFGAVTDGAWSARQILDAASPGASNVGGALAAPRIGVAVTSNGQISLGFNSRTGIRYRIQVATSLAERNWQTVLDRMGDGGLITYEESVRPDREGRFYRALVE